MLSGNLGKITTLLIFSPTSLLILILPVFKVVLPTSAQALRLAAEVRVAQRKSTKTAVSRFLNFQTHCSNLRIPMEPPSYEAVADFLIQFQLRNHGHTASLSGLLSNLRTQYRARNMQFLGVSGETLLAQLLTELKLADTTPVRAMSPLRFSLLLRCLDRLNLSDVIHLQEAASLMFAQNALLRTAEATSGLRADDFLWSDNNQTVSVHLKPTKTVLRGAGVHIEVRASKNPLCGVRLLRRLWEARDLDCHPQDFVFCTINHRIRSAAGCRLNPTVPATANAYRRLIKRMVSSIGLDPSKYSGHSLRSGGVTDLFAAGTPYYVIKKMGRWKSDAALLYFRSESDVARIAAKAFD